MRMTQDQITDRKDDIVPQYFNPLTQQFEALNGNGGAALFTNQRRIWREDFAGVALDPALWQVVRQGAGQTITVVNSELRIDAGITANSETIIRSVKAFPVPVLTQFIFMLSQRIANQEFILRLTNAAGDMRFQCLMSGTNPWAQTFSVANGGVSGATVTESTMSTANLFVVGLELFSESAHCFTRAVDSSGLTPSGRIFNRQLSDPNQNYHVEIVARNLATPPASPTILTIDAITTRATSEIGVDILASRGSSSHAQGLPVTVNPLSTVVTASNNTVFADTSTPLGTANAVFTGTARDFTTTQRTNRFRAASTADVAGTLFIEQSNDGTNWVMTHRQDTVALADSGGVTRHIAQIDAPVVNRFARVAYRNGATGQTAFRLISMQVGV